MTELTELRDISRCTVKSLQDHFGAMVANIRDTINGATETQVNLGMSWYYEAHAFALGLAEENDLSLQQTAGIISTLSPNVKWPTNKVIAEMLVQDHEATIAAYPLSKGKALDIINGRHPVDVIGRESKKTLHFYYNILSPADNYHVTNDVWAERALLGCPTVHRDDCRLSNTPGKYDVCASVFRFIADEVEILPSQAQAIPWVVYHELYG
jgi:hypothetical protein